MINCNLTQYKPHEWLDDIVSIGPDGKIEYERDSEGNLVQAQGPFGEPLFNPLTGDPIWKMLKVQEGTRITAERLNHIESGLCSSYNQIDTVSNGLEYVMIILDIEGSVQGGQGNFFDSFDSLNPKDMTWDKRKMIATRPIESNDVITQVEDTTTFKIGDNLFIYDDVNFEKVTVQEVVSSTEIKLGQTKVYKKGAFIARSTMLPNRVDSKFDMDSWDTYNTSYVVV